MSTLSRGESFNSEKERDLVEQRRLSALVEITKQHNRESSELKPKLNQLESEIKALRASNPVRMKKLINRLQE